MNEIVTGLWLGSYPFEEDAPKLWSAGIKAILTLDLEPLSEAVFGRFIRKFMRLLDEPNQDILGILEEALAFIETSLLSGGVLVHCAMGVSRSASIVIAFLMRKHRTSYNDALLMVMQRRQVFPNIGFVNQLKLFEAMNWTVDVNSPVYVHYSAMKTYMGANHVYRKNDAATPDSGAQNVAPATYRCRKCRRFLFCSSQVLNHCIPDQSVERLKKSMQESDEFGDLGISAVLIKGITINEVPLSCTRELFTGPLEWTRIYAHDIEGKLYCPGCQSKLGSFNWCGEPCVCGTWVTPAFHFNRHHLDKIDYRNPLPTVDQSIEEVSSNDVPATHSIGD